MKRSAVVPIRSLAQVRAEFDRQGLSYAHWAREHGFAPSQVHDVIRGRSIGRRGISHNIAVLLGLKAGVASEAAALCGHKPRRKA